MGGGYDECHGYCAEQALLSPVKGGRWVWKKITKTPSRAPLYGFHGIKSLIAAIIFGKVHLGKVNLKQPPLWMGKTNQISIKP